MVVIALGKKSKTITKHLYSSICIWLSETRGTSHNTDEASELKRQGQSVGGAGVGVFLK